MERAAHKLLVEYLQHKKFSNIISHQQKRSIRNLARRCILEDGVPKLVDIKHDRLCVIPQAEEIGDILKRFHNHPSAGHLGVNNTFFKIRQAYYWKGMYKDIRKHVETCDSCQRSGRPV